MKIQDVILNDLHTNILYYTIIYILYLKGMSIYVHMLYMIDVWEQFY